MNNILSKYTASIASLFDVTVQQVEMSYNIIGETQARRMLLRRGLQTLGMLELIHVLNVKEPEVGFLTLRFI
jgi:hypothetical protein